MLSFWGRDCENSLYLICKKNHYQNYNLKKGTCFGDLLASASEYQILVPYA